MKTYKIISIEIYPANVQVGIENIADAEDYRTLSISTDGVEKEDGTPLHHCYGRTKAYAEEQAAFIVGESFGAQLLNRYLEPISYE